MYYILFLIYLILVQFKGEFQLDKVFKRNFKILTLKYPRKMQGLLYVSGSLTDV